MISEDTYFEMVVAALNRTAMPGADVQWNLKLQGRQFDVIITIPTGLYTLMLAIEVKNHARRIETTDIEAFVTKGKDANANKLVFVSAKGFQSGCHDVAKRHGVELFELTLKAPDEVKFPEGAFLVHGKGTSPPTADILPEEPGNSFERVTVIYEDGSAVLVPDETTQMRYYLERTSAGGRSLLDLIAPDTVPTLEEGSTRTIAVPVECEVVPPDEFFIRRGLVKELKVEVRGVTHPVISGNVAFETTALSPIATYKNVITGAFFEARLVDLPFGPETFEAGNFYFAYHPLRYVYCDNVKSGIATILIIESFQRGVLFRTSFDCDVDCSRFYIPISRSETKLLRRLEFRLEAMRKLMA